MNIVHIVWLARITLLFCCLLTHLLADLSRPSTTAHPKFSRAFGGTHRKRGLQGQELPCIIVRGGYFNRDTLCAREDRILVDSACLQGMEKIPQGRRTNGTLGATQGRTFSSFSHRYALSVERRVEQAEMP